MFKSARAESGGKEPKDAGVPPTAEFFESTGEGFKGRGNGLRKHQRSGGLWV